MEQICRFRPPDSNMGETTVELIINILIQIGTIYFMLWFFWKVARIFWA